MNSVRPLRILVAFGTRPEAIKLAPVIRELRRRGTAEVRAELLTVLTPAGGAPSALEGA